MIIVVCKGSISKSMKDIGVIVRIVGGFGIDNAEVFGSS